jgi:hypothetical protein
MSAAKPLENYAPEYRIESASGRGTYTVKDVEGKLVCECAWATHHPGIYCRHAFQVLLQRSQAMAEHLAVVHVRDLETVGEDFESVVDRVMFFKGYEARTLGSLALLLAAKSEDGTVTADDVYEAVGGAFDADPRIMGIVWAQLRAHGMTEFLRYEASHRNHGRPITRLRITDQGRRIVAGAV